MIGAKTKWASVVLAFSAACLAHAGFWAWKGGRLTGECGPAEGIPFSTLYFAQQNYLMGLSYALTAAFTVYALLRLWDNRRKGVAGLIGGVTLTGALYFAGCFLIGCCGSPMLPIYLGFLGPRFLGFTKPFTLALMAIAVVFGFLWMEKRRKVTACGCAEPNCGTAQPVPEGDPLAAIQTELQMGIELAKCRKCGCMKEALENLGEALGTTKAEGASALAVRMPGWLSQMEPVQYSCLGCPHCYPATATNLFHQAFPDEKSIEASACAFEAHAGKWPPVPGEYHVLGVGSDRPVAVSTLASVDLADKLARLKPDGLCIVGKIETENIGIDKVIKNTITNPAIRYLLLTGQDSQGHLAGQTLIALSANGVDDSMRVKGSLGRRPILKNVTREEVETFRRQVEVPDMIGCEDVDQIIARIKELAAPRSGSGHRNATCSVAAASVPVSKAPVIEAEEPSQTELDKAGYFVILPIPEKHVISVEHYANDNRLLRTIEGKTARSIYGAISRNGWVTQLSHAAYLGKELGKAELSLRLGFKYIQDGA